LLLFRFITRLHKTYFSPPLQPVCSFSPFLLVMTVVLSMRFPPYKRPLPPPGLEVFYLPLRPRTWRRPLLFLLSIRSRRQRWEVKEYGKSTRLTSRGRATCSFLGDTPLSLYLAKIHPSFYTRDFEHISQRIPTRGYVVSTARSILGVSLPPLFLDSFDPQPPPWFPPL